MSEKNVLRCFASAKSLSPFNTISLYNISNSIGGVLNRNYVTMTTKGFGV